MPVQLLGTAVINIVLFLISTSKWDCNFKTSNEVFVLNGAYKSFPSNTKSTSYMPAPRLANVNSLVLFSKNKVVLYPLIDKITLPINSLAEFIFNVAFSPIVILSHVRLSKVV